MSITKKQADSLRAQIRRYVRAAVDESWAGGMEREAAAEVEAELDRQRKQLNRVINNLVDPKEQRR